MENKKFILLVVLVSLSLLVSAGSFVVLTSKLSSLTQSQLDRFPAEVEQTQLHLYTAPRRSGPAIARIGEKKITKAELEEQFGNLPSQLIVPFKTRQDTLNFLRQYIGLELIYQQAINQGWGRDSAILVQTQEAKRGFMIDRYLSTNLAEYQLPPTEEEIRLSYQANKSGFGDRAFEESKEEIAALLTKQHQRRAYQNLVEQLWKSADIEIYEDSL